MGSTMTSPAEVDTRRRALVVGTGLIGGSIALGLRRRGWHVSGLDADEERLRAALEAGVIDAAGDDLQAEVVFVAVPAAAVAGVVRGLLDGDGRFADAVVTDVSGVKTAIVEEADHPRFIGGHPMAGSEQAGLHGADPDLFEGAVWVLTPTAATDLEAFNRLKGVVMSLGADVLVLSAADHDRLVAVVSHVPHLVAATLMNAATDGAEQDGALLRLAAGGFRDMTRVAAGQPGIWLDICAENAAAIVAALDALRHRPGRHAGACCRSRPDGAPRLAAAGQCGTEEPSGSCRAARPPGRASYPGPGPGGRPGRDHLVGRRCRHRHLRHRDRALGRGAAGVLILVVDSADADTLAVAVESHAGTAAEPSTSHDGAPRPGRRRRDTVPRHHPHARREVDLAPRRPDRSTGGGHVGHPRALRWRRRRRLPGGGGSHGGRSGAPRRRDGRRPWWPGSTAPPGGTARLRELRDLHALADGLVAGFDWETELVGDESLSSRPMDRVAEPLGLMGATVVGAGPRCQPPLRSGVAPCTASTGPPRWRAPR